MDEAKAREQAKWIRLKMEGVIIIRQSEEHEVETIIAEAIYRAYQRGRSEADNAALRAEVERLREALEKVLESGSIRESERIAQAALQAGKVQGE